jgi:hypothetical protein
MDPATIGLLISTLLGGSVIKHETLLENPKEMYGYGLEGYGLEGYGLDDYGLGFRYPPVPLIEAEIPRKSRKGTEYKIKKKIPQPDDRWVVTYLLNTKNKPPRKPNTWMQYVKEAFKQAKEKYDEYLENELKVSDRQTYDRLMSNRKKREARKKQLPLAIRYSPGALELYNKYKDLPTENLLAHYYSAENIKSIPSRYRPIVLAVKEGKEPPKLQEIIATVSEKKTAKRAKAKK